MNVPDAAIEAAAEALWREGTHPLTGRTWASLTENGRNHWRGLARAAVPAIREALAQEIEAGMKRPKNIFDDEGHYGRQGMADAASIVRGGTP